MIQDNEIIVELESMQSPLAGLDRHMPYALPEGYFGQLAGSIAQGVAWSESEDPAPQLPKSMPFELSEAYLSDLPQRLTEAAIKSSEMAGRSLPFEVPEGYFSTLPGKLVVAAQSSGQPAGRGKIVAFNAGWRRRSLQWALAAMLVLGAGLGTYRFTHPYTPEAAVMRQLSRIDADILNAYVEQHIDEFDTDLLEASAARIHTGSYMQVSGLDEQDIYQYLSEEEGAM